MMAVRLCGTSTVTEIMVAGELVFWCQRFRGWGAITRTGITVFPAHYFGAAAIVVVGAAATLTATPNTLNADFTCLTDAAPQNPGGHPGDQPLSSSTAAAFSIAPAASSKVQQGSTSSTARRARTAQHRSI
ncbi:hypothetical protein F5884DRAFT_831444 [Xylogone sp. PMI_703]|nr:hypothetical protein F5884DRAFT_831444 [Xylogone sp. PMI_703]